MASYYSLRICLTLVLAAITAYPLVTCWPTWSSALASYLDFCWCTSCWRWISSGLKKTIVIMFASAAVLILLLLLPLPHTASLGILFTGRTCALHATTHCGRRVSIVLTPLWGKKQVISLVRGVFFSREIFNFTTERQVNKVIRAIRVIIHPTSGHDTLFFVRVSQSEMASDNRRHTKNWPKKILS